MSGVDRRHSSGGTARSRNVRFAVAAVATFCLVATAVLALVLAGGARGDSGERSVPTARQAGVESDVARAAVGRRTGAVIPETPHVVRLPSGAAVPIRPVATTAGGTLAVPSDVNVSGWWRGGSRIGDPFGSNLLAAHVDSASQGLGPFAELLTARAGQSIVLTSANLQQEYVVSSLRLLPKGPLSAHPWVYSPSGPHRLTLVTCAGPYIASRGGYLNLAVVTATAVGEPTQRES